MTISLSISNPASPTTAINAADVTTPDNELLAHINNLLNGAQAFDAQLWSNSTATLATDTLSLSGKPRALIIDTEGGAAFDTLGTISNGTAYQQLWIRAASAARVITVSNSSGNLRLNGGADVTLSATSWMLLFYDGTQWSDVFVPATSYTSPAFNGRLTLTSATPVTTSDVTAATNVYVTPFRGNRVALYSGSAWVTYTFSEITISLSGLAADKNYDVFVYLSGGVVVAEQVVWTNDTTRATALVLQDGVYVKTGTTTKRYVGTFRTTVTIGQCEDSVTKRYVWNYYNRVERDFFLIEATNSWTYATATWHAWNGSTSNRFSFVRGVNEDAVSVSFSCNISATAAVSGAIAIGLDSTSVPSGRWSLDVAIATVIVASYVGKPSEGFHYLQLLEYSSAATTTFLGDNGATVEQSGADGKMAA